MLKELRINMAQTGEIQLFIIWSTARDRESFILDEIKSQFKILEIYEIEWSKKTFKRNLDRLYFEKFKRKIWHTGTGKFLLITVLDENPEYAYEKTLKGFECVNKKTVCLKRKIRNITKKYNFHCTNAISEVDQNLSFFINKNYDNYYEYAKNVHFDGNYIRIKSEPVGTFGWKNLDEIFDLFNSSCKYCLLKNVDEQDGVIDILVDNLNKVNFILNAREVIKEKYFRCIKVDVSGKEYTFNVRCVDDNYFCEKWENDMLKNRIFNQAGYYSLSPDDSKYSLLYHIFFHKEEIPSKYIGFLNRLAFNRMDLYKELSEFLDANDYYVVRPNDKKIKLNTLNCAGMEWVKLLSSKYGFENIEEFRVNKKPSSGFTHFFTADYDGHRVFIKCGNGIYDAKKEFELYKTLHEQNPKYFPKAYMYRNLSNNRMFLCTEYIDGINLSQEFVNKISDPEALQNMFNSLYEIAATLFKNKFIHRDLNGGNLIVTGNGIIKLIDFQHLIGGQFKENPENIIYPKKLRGTNKHLRPAPFVWDDMYSIYKMMKLFEKSHIEDYDVKLNVIKSKIGKLKYYFFDNKFPFISFINFKYLFIYKTISIFKRPFRKLLK